MTNGFENRTDELFFDEREAALSSAAGGEKAASSKGVSRPPPWGPWATVGWTLLCLGVLFGAQIAVVVIFILVHWALGSDIKPESLEKNGNVAAVGMLASTPMAIALVALLVWVRSCRLREYLALSWPDARSILLSIAGMAMVLTLTDVTSWMLGRPIVPEVMVDLYRNSWLPFFVFAVVVLAPLGEETLFRGFLYKGIESSRAGPVTAIVVSTFLFAVVHLQYDWYGILGVGVMGLYLGLVRYWCSSVWLTMTLHSIANLVASVEVLILLHRGA